MKSFVPGKPTAANYVCEVGTNFDDWKTLITIVGPPGAGKTTTGASISELFPHDEPLQEKRKLIFLEDTLFISADANGPRGLRALGLKVHNIDLDKECLKLCDNNGVADMPIILPGVERAVQKYIEEYGVKHVVCDTISKINYLLSIYHTASQYAPKDGRQGWNKVLAATRNFQANITRLPAESIIWLSHPRALEEPDKEKKEAADRKHTALTADPMNVNVMMDVSGRGANLFRQDVDLICSIQKVSKGINKFERRLFNTPVNGFEAKSRFEGIVPPDTEPDLYKLINLVKAREEEYGEEKTT